MHRLADGVNPRFTQPRPLRVEKSPNKRCTGAKQRQKYGTRPYSVRHKRQTIKCNCGGGGSGGGGFGRGWGGGAGLGGVFSVLRAWARFWVGGCACRADGGGGGRRAVWRRFGGRAGGRADWAAGGAAWGGVVTRALPTHKNMLNTRKRCPLRNDHILETLIVHTDIIWC